MQTAVAVVLALLLVGFVAADEEYQLRYLNASSGIPTLAFLFDPTLGINVNDYLQGTYDLVTLGPHLVVQGYENAHAPYVDTFPKLIVYNRSGDVLVEKSRVYAVERFGTSNAVTSRNTAQPFAAVSTYTPINDTEPVSLFLPHKFLIDIYGINVATGEINQVPLSTLDMSTLDPDFYSMTAAYSGIGGMSDDGKYVVVSYTVGNFFFGTAEQKLEILSLSSTGVLSSAVKVTLPPADVFPMVHFTQKVRMVEDAAGHYIVVVAANSYNIALGDIFGKTGAMLTYHFDSTAGTLVLTGNIPNNHYVQGFDISPNHRRISAVTNLVQGAETPLVRRKPYENAAFDKGNELRVFSYVPTQTTPGALSLILTRKLNENGIVVRYSNNGKMLALVTSPSLYATILPNPLIPGVTFPVYSPGTVRIVNAQGDKYQAASLSALVAPLPFGITWTDDDSTVIVGGQSNPVSQDIVMYAVDS